MREIFTNDRGLRAGWRFVLFLALYIAGESGLGCVLPKVHFPDRSFTWHGILANDAADFALVAAITWVLARLEHRRFSDFGLRLSTGAGRLLAKGLVWGFIPSALILIPIFLAGGCSFHGLALGWRDLVFYAVAWGLAMLAIGFTEEFLFRGYAQVTLADGIGFWPAAVILSSMFGLVHLLFKPLEDWIDPVSIALYGLFWCLTLRRTGSLWFAVGFHAASDYADMIVFAEPNSGNDGKPLPGHLMNLQFHGPDWLTGGPRGTEASLLVFVVLAGLFYFFNKAYPARPERRG